MATPQDLEKFGIKLYKTGDNRRFAAQKGGYGLGSGLSEITGQEDATLPWESVTDLESGKMAQTTGLSPNVFNTSLENYGSISDLLGKYSRNALARGAGGELLNVFPNTPANTSQGAQPGAMTPIQTATQKAGTPSMTTTPAVPAQNIAKQQLIQAPIPQFNPAFGANYPGGRANWALDHRTGIIDAYEQSLGRTPSQQEVDWWLQNEPNIERVKAGIMGSDEAKQRSQAAPVQTNGTSPLQAAVAGMAPKSPLDTLKGQLTGLPTEESLLTKTMGEYQIPELQKRLNESQSMTERGIYGEGQRPIARPFITGRQSAIAQQGALEQGILERELSSNKELAGLVLQARQADNKTSRDAILKQIAKSEALNDPIDIKTALEYGVKPGTTLADIISGKATPTLKKDIKDIQNIEDDAGNVRTVITYSDGTQEVKNQGVIGTKTKGSGTGGGENNPKTVKSFYDELQGWFSKWISTPDLSREQVAITLKGQFPGLSDDFINKSVYAERGGLLGDNNMKKQASGGGPLF